MDLSVGGRVERRGGQGRVNLVWNKERAVQSGQAASSAVKFEDKTKNKDASFRLD